MTYDELQTLIRAQLDENPAVDQLNSWFQFAEAWFDQELRVREMEVGADLTAVIDGVQAIVTLPDDFIEARQVSSKQTPARVLQAATPDEIVSLAPVTGIDALLYTISGNNMFIAPPRVTEIALLYYAKIPRLSATVQTNWLSLRSPYLYYYRVLFEAATFMNNAAKAGAYEAKCQQIIQEMEERDAATYYANATVRVRTPVA